MSLVAVLISCLLPLAATQFIPPDAILQAGYPAGFRAYIPDFPGCELFAFHGKINSPFDGEEAGTFSQDILRPQGGYWIYQDLNIILTPGDIIHYWTLIVKDKVGYPKKNMTWKVPDPDESVDLLSPITLKPPRSTPEKVKNTDPTTPIDDATMPPIETTSASNDDTPSPTTPEPSEISTSSPATTTTTTKNPSTTTTTATTKATPTTTKTPDKPKTTKPKKSTPANPIKEEVEELTTPASPLDTLGAGGFPQEPSLFPFPSLFPRPLKPMMPPGPGFEICSNPWNFEEQLGETRTQRLERQVAKLQCELALFQRGYNQLSNTVENELTDLKKLIYGMVSRMARLESVLRSAAFG